MRRFCVLLEQKLSRQFLVFAASRGRTTDGDAKLDSFRGVIDFYL